MCIDLYINGRTQGSGELKKNSWINVDKKVLTCRW